MTKTLETKRKILQLLKKKQMTISELSDQLNLSTATVSQHMDELQQSGAIERVNNEYFKKLKYYKASETTNPITTNYLKYVVGVIIILALASGFYAYQLNRSNSLQVVKNVNSTSSSASTTVPSGGGIVGGGGSFACPMLFYHINGSVYNYSGFAAYNLTSSNGNVTDYLLPPGGSGSLYVSEFINNVPPEPANFSANINHYALLTQAGRAFNGTAPGLNWSISPENFTVLSNETVNSTLDVVISKSAPEMSYWLRIDGPCGGGVTPVLITVGNMPYNGSLTPGVVPYA